MTQAETANALGISTRTLRTWGERGCPIGGSVPEITEWRDKHMPPRQGGPASVGKAVGAGADSAHPFAVLWQAGQIELQAIDDLQARLDRGECSDLPYDLRGTLLGILFAIWLRLPANRHLLVDDGSDEYLEAWEAAVAEFDALQLDKLHAGKSCRKRVRKRAEPNG
jgi:hypothetical protein